MQFGGVDRDVPGKTKADGLLPGVSGLQIGIVTSNEDPDCLLYTSRCV